MDILPLWVGFSLVLGSCLNLVIWMILGFRPRHGFKVCIGIVAELLAASPLGWLAVMASLIAAGLIFYWMGDEHFHHMAKSAVWLDDLVGPSVHVLDAMALPEGLVSHRQLDDLPDHGRVVVMSFLRPGLERHLRRRGFQRVWTTNDWAHAWPVWVREGRRGPA